MYPLHKYLPTPFGTYLLYIDNGPTRVKVNNDKQPLPSYQVLKEHGRKQQQQQQQIQHVSKYQAFQKSTGARTSAPAKIQHTSMPKISGAERKIQTYTPSSNMPTSIWSPKVKRMHLSYNMRQLWHTGQPVKDPPSKVVAVDGITGAELVTEAQWHKDRSSKEHEGITTSPGFKERLASEDSRLRSNLSFRSDYSDRIRSSAHAGRNLDADFAKSGKWRPKVPPNTAANSPILSEVYKRQASNLRNDMVPRMQKKSKRGSRAHRQREEGSSFYRAHVNKETQTTPMRFAKTSMEYATGDISPGVLGLSSPQRSSSVPINTPASSGNRRAKNCVEKTGLPPILEAEAAPQNKEPKPIPKTVETIETDMWRQRVRRVQEFRSASPTFPIKSKGEFWEEVTKGRLPKPGSHGLLPFAWKEPERFHTEEGHVRQQRAVEMEKILPVITRMPSIPRVAPH